MDFTEAFADVELKDIDFYHSDESIGGKLVPDLGPSSLFAVQVTELKCGGVVLGGVCDHRLVDAYSSHMFFLARAEFAQGKPFSHNPFFSRSLLEPRHPGRYYSSIEEQYVLVKEAKKTTKKHPPGIEMSKISRTYYAESKKIVELQSQTNKRTKIEAFSTFVWKLMALSADKSSNRRQMKCR